MGAKWTSEAASLSCLKECKIIGATAMQIFTRSNRSWHTSALDSSVAQHFRKHLTKSDLQVRCAPQKTIDFQVVAHASYLINLATDKEELARKSTDALLCEMERCEQLGIKYLILHPGSHTGIGVEKGIKLIANRLSEVVK